MIALNTRIRQLEAEVAELQERLRDRTEQAMATALRDAKTIRELRAALVRGEYP